MVSEAELFDALYALLPTMECKGECAHFCATTITMSRFERKRIEDEIGVMTYTPRGWCTMLDRDGRCRAQEVKPMFCRLWGMVEDMPCPYGCKPKPRYLTVQEGAEFLRKADEIGGKGFHLREMLGLPV